jgi:hypothetical protein
MKGTIVLVSTRILVHTMFLVISPDFVMYLVRQNGSITLTIQIYCLFKFKAYKLIS